MQNQAPKFIDLFAGCGGLSLGLEEAGFVPVFVNELSPQAMETYLANRAAAHPLLASKYNVNDIKDLVLSPGRLEDLADGLRRDHGIDVAAGELDLVAGGPPCQGFSGIGHRRSYSVAREQLPSNHLYQDMAHVIHKLRPRMFLFENVEGLIRGRWTPEGEKGEIWADVLQTFCGIPGYSVRWKLVHAKDYGVPQNRPRVLLVGVRDDQPFAAGEDGDAVQAGYLPAPSGEAPGMEAIWSDLVDPAYEPGGRTTAYPHAPRNPWQEAMRLDPRSGKVLPMGAPVTDHEYSKHSPHVVAKFRHMLDNGGELLDHMRTKKFAQRVLPREWGPKGPTITATSLPDDYVHYSQPRIPTVREWARLQTFPDWYLFKGKRTTGGLRRAGNPRIGLHEREVPKYTQIGNAVPVTLAAAVGAHFKGLLER